MFHSRLVLCSAGSIAEEFINCADVSFPGDGFTPGRSDNPGLKQPGVAAPAPAPGPPVSVGSGYFKTGICKDINSDCSVFWFNVDSHCNDKWWQGQCPVRCSICTPDDEDTSLDETPSLTPTPATLSPTPAATQAVTAAPTKNLRTNSPTRAPVKTSKAPSPSPPIDLPIDPVVCKDDSAQCRMMWFKNDKENYCKQNTWKGNCQLTCDNCPADRPECDGLEDIPRTGTQCNNPDLVPSDPEGYCTPGTDRGWWAFQCERTCCR